MGDSELLKSWAMPLLLKHLLLGGLQLGQRGLQLPVTALQGRLRPVALGDVLEAHDHAGQLLALDHRRAHVVDRKVAAVGAREDLVARLPGGAVTQGRGDLRVGVGHRGAVGPQVHDHRADQLADAPAGVHPEHGGRGRIHEGDAAIGVEPEDPVAGRFQDQGRLLERPLVEAPRDHAADARPQHERGVDARPGPRRVVGGLVVVDRLGPEHADHAVVHGDEADREDVGDPVLAQGQEGEHHEEVEVELDVAPGEMHEDRRGAHQAESHERGLRGASHPPPARQQAEGRHDQRFADGVQCVGVVEQRPGLKLPALAHDRPGQRDDHDVEERQTDEKAMPGPPHVLGEGSAGGDERPQSLQQRWRARPDCHPGRHRARAVPVRHCQTASRFNCDRAGRRAGRDQFSSYSWHGDPPDDDRIRGDQTRFTALTTARNDAVTMLASSPTPQRVLPPMRASTYAAARASAPSPSACSL
jgi:hypothetical protein